MATVTEARPAKPSKFKRRRKNPGDSVARAIALGRRPPASGGNVAACAPCAAVEAPDWARRPVAYVHSAAGVAAASLHPQHPNRPRMVHALLNAYGLVDRMSVLSEVAVDRYTLTKVRARMRVRVCPCVCACLVLFVFDLLGWFRLGSVGFGWFRLAT
eukprot:SAG31_NODE_404_length_16109_cov_10.686696_13_plen_158_part_00